MKSAKNFVRDIFKAQGIYVHGDIPEPSAEAIKILTSFGTEMYNNGYDEGFSEAEHY